MTMTGNDRFSIQDILPFLLKKKKFVQVTGALLHFDSLFFVPLHQQSKESFSCTESRSLQTTHLNPD